MLASSVIPVSTTPSEASRALAMVGSTHFSQWGVPTPNGNASRRRLSMSITRCRPLAVLVVWGCLPSLLSLYGLDLPPASPPATLSQVQPYSDTTYPQIV